VTSSAVKTEAAKESGRDVCSALERADDIGRRRFAAAVSQLHGGPRDRQGELEPGSGHRPRSGGEGLTLETRISRVWEGLLAAGLAECPVCGGELERLGSAGHCLSCGSELS
jgi:hypothetical protein